MHTNVVAITGVSQSITIATTFLQLQLQLLITDIFLDACKSYYTLPRFHICGDQNHVIDVIFLFPPAT